MAWSDNLSRFAKRAVVSRGALLAGSALGVSLASFASSAAPFAATPDNDLTAQGVTVRLAQTAAPSLPAATPPAAGAAAPAADATPAPPAIMVGPLKFTIQGEAGILFNTDRPADGLNYGQLFTDRANQAQLNQLLLGVEKDVDPKATGFDWGFKVQFQYGSDSRYTHFLGELDRVTSDRMQLDIIEADVSLHLPWLTEGGTDVKIGEYPTPVGFEVMNPASNPFYSHSYIFNFGLPLKHTGFYAETHVIPLLDIYYGVDTGENTTFGAGAGDNNGAAAGLAGFGINLLDGNLTLVALSHFGPENPNRTVPGANQKFRYENDAYLTWKANDKLTLVSEVNWIRDDAFHADAYGGAQYVGYALSDTVTANGRAEIYRDNNNFFVAAFPGNTDFRNVEAGDPTGPLVFSPKGATYSEYTAGVTWKPAVPAPIATFMVRPEVRYDTTLDGVKPYSGRSHAWTFGADVILGF